MALAVRRKLPAAYYALIEEFPLTHIRDDEHLTEALAVIDRLLQQPWDEGTQQYLDVLTDMVESYENANEDFAGATETDVLSELMRQHGLTQTSLSRKTGISQSTLSEVLHGKRSLTKEQVITLSKQFNLKPTAFLPAVDSLKFAQPQ